MKTLLFLLVSLALAGCCSMERCEELVGECEKETEIVEGAAQTVFLEMPAISVPEPVVLECESWTEEMIREDPVGYEEVLYEDILMLVDRDVSLIDYLGRLEAARQKLKAEADATN